MKLFSKKKIWLVFSLAAVFSIIFVTHFQHNLNADEGVVLDGAWNIYNNRHLYVDFFEFIPPGSFYLIFVIWKIFGVSFWPARIASICIAFGIALLLYFCAQNIKKSSWNILPSFLFAIASSSLWLINHNIFNLFFSLWSIYFVMQALNNKKLTYYFLGGLLTGIAAMFLQQKGVVLSGAIFLFLLIDEFKNWKRLIGYCLGTILPLFILCLWPLKLIYDDLVDFPIFNYVEVNKINPIRFYIAIIVIVIFAFIMRKEKNKKIRLILFTSLFAVLATYPLPDNYHIILALTPLLILFGVMMSKIQRQKTISARIVSYYAVAVVVILGFGNVIYLPNFQKNNYDWMKILKLCPGQYIYAGPFIPNIYFETGKLNATPYPFLVTKHNTKSQFQEAKEYLIKRKPSCATLIYPDSMRRFKHDKNNPVESWIKENYSLSYSDSTVEIYNLR